MFSLQELNKPLNPFDNSVLGPDIKSEKEPVEDIIASLDPSETSALLHDLDEIMPIPQMEAYLNYLAVGLDGSFNIGGSRGYRGAFGGQRRRREGDPRLRGGTRGEDMRGRTT